MNYLLVGIGAGIGGALRYFISTYASVKFSVYFPYGTLLVNLIGSIILGFLIFGYEEKDLVSNNLKLLIGVGFCGGLTTFSTFSYETFNLLKSTEFMLAFVNVFLNLFLTIAGIYIG
jgi:CrcB protein